MKNKISFDYLPYNLVESLDNLFGNLPDKYIMFNRDFRSKNNCLFICSVIFCKQFEDVLSDFVGLSANYWKKIIGNHYIEYLKLLLEQNIIQRKWDEFDTGDGVVTLYGYRINPKFNTGKFKKVNYGQGAKVATIIVNEKKGLKSTKKFDFNLDKIRIHNKNVATAWIKQNALGIVQDSISFNYYDDLDDKITLNFIKFNKDSDSRKYQFLSIGKAKEIAKDNGVQLFNYKGSNIIADVDYFINKTSENLKNHYLWRIANFDSKDFNLTRHVKTRRLYGQTVSLPSNLLPFVRIHNQYIMQCDLKTSQFVIFANIINQYIKSGFDGAGLLGLYKNAKSKEFIRRLVCVLDAHKDSLSRVSFTNNSSLNYSLKDDDNDVFNFLQDVLFSDFYTIIKNKLKLPSRRHSKLWTFTVIFGSEKTNNSIKSQVKQMYPTVINIIDDFKSKYKSNQFPIGLQVVEAEIFIDNILKSAHENHITSFTRHDSILFAISKKLEVEKIINDTQNRFDFIGNFKFEFFNEEVIEDYDLFNPEDEIDEYLQLTTVNENNKMELKPRKSYETYFNDFEVNTMVKLGSFGIMDNYSEDVNTDFLWEIYELSILTEKEKAVIENELSNRYGESGVYVFTLFSDTNDVIRNLVKRVDNLD